MQRRDFLKKSSLGLAAGAASVSASAPVLAQSAPTIKWRLASSYPKSLDTIYGAGEMVANRVAQLTDGRFKIQVFAGGEIVPALQVLDAVQQGTVECGHTTSSFYVGKNRAFAFDTVVPFGLTPRQQMAWMYYGGGLQLMRELFKDYGVVNFPCGNTGAQMGGWFRKEIHSLADLKGLKMRIPGLGGEVLSRLGAVPQNIPAGDVYAALEKGAIDATEWVGPYDDEKLGFYKVAKYYYAPGWWEPSAQVTLIVNAKEWEKLPKTYQYALDVACAEANMHMLAEYDAKNPLALAKLLKAGVQLKRFSTEIMVAAQKAAFDFYNEEAARNPAFKKIFVEWEKFRRNEQAWFSLNDAAIEQFMYSHNK
ncbi:TRAP transporter substrate-binding protein [Oryzomicrobium sp.]|uniref:TRAP transporter substrate-binding protein n=1 Tax=Oryzomicrobium sp. TaxID=1911578 RepID=UPI0025CEB4D8|nr:TRAP transporter substrate-binding protein [Oryzomicrobium sp.]MCE1244422.1 TRAP transporter substrate-binding protein [Oryzomicrobium sp.]